MSSKKPKIKFLYKQLIYLKNNVENNKKIFKFKAKWKWLEFIQNYKIKLKWHKLKRLQDQTQLYVFKYTNQFFAYKNNYKLTLQELKWLQFLFGKLSRKNIKKKIKTALKTKHKQINFFYIKEFEWRLDIVLYWAKFTTSIRQAWQLIFHKKVQVNCQFVTVQSYWLKTGDIVCVYLNQLNLTWIDIKKLESWPMPPKHLIINYKTLQLVFGVLTNKSLPLNFFQYFNLEKLLVNFHKV